MDNTNYVEPTFFWSLDELNKAQIKVAKKSNGHYICPFQDAGKDANLKTIRHCSTLKFPNIGTFNRHLKNHNRLNNGKLQANFRCKYCGKYYVYTSFKKHQADCNKKFICEFCYREFTWRSARTKHYKTCKLKK